MSVHRILHDAKTCTNLPTCRCNPVYIESEYPELGGLYVHQPARYLNLFGEALSENTREELLRGLENR